MSPERRNDQRHDQAGGRWSGAASQGLAAGEFTELVRAIRAGATYVNVHTTGHPGGEIRAQLEDKKHGDKD